MLHVDCLEPLTDREYNEKKKLFPTITNINWLINLIIRIVEHGFCSSWRTLRTIIFPTYIIKYQWKLISLIDEKERERERERERGRQDFEYFNSSQAK